MVFTIQALTYAPLSDVQQQLSFIEIWTKINAQTIFQKYRAVIISAVITVSTPFCKICWNTETL